MTQKEVLAYAAGIIDGEGSVLLRRRRKWRTPAISVTSTSSELLEWLKETFGGAISSKGEKRPNHKPSWQWAIGSKKTMELLPQLYPYIREHKKKLRIEHIVTYYQSSQMKGTQEKFEEDFYLLGTSSASELKVSHIPAFSGDAGITP